MPLRFGVFALSPKGHHLEYMDIPACRRAELAGTEYSFSHSVHHRPMRECLAVSLAACVNFFQMSCWRSRRAEVEVLRVHVVFKIHPSQPASRTNLSQIQTVSNE